jgi:hypothetical protein
VYWLRGRYRGREAPEAYAELCEEFKGGIHGLFGPLHRVGGFVVAADDGVGSELVGAQAFKRMPVADCKTQMLGHRFAQNLVVGVVVLEGEGIFGVRSFVFDLFDFRKKLCHNNLPYKS